MYPLDAYLFKLAQWLPVPRPLARLHSWGASRDALSLTVSAPRLSDLLSNSRSGVPCPVTPWIGRSREVPC